jgi:uncharacterized protein
LRVQSGAVGRIHCFLLVLDGRHGAFLDCFGDVVLFIPAVPHGTTRTFRKRKLIHEAHESVVARAPLATRESFQIFLAQRTTTTMSRRNGGEGGGSLAEAARKAVTEYSSDWQVAFCFCQSIKEERGVDFIGQSNDRLVKLGRRIIYLVRRDQKQELQLSKNDDDDDDDDRRLEQSLQCLVDECRILLEIGASSTSTSTSSGTNNNKSSFQIPRVRFGKTALRMPIITLGCMRFQQEWGPRITNMDQVGSDVQDNLVAILKYAIRVGMVHIETARGYGSSELQLGCALQQLFVTDYVQRNELIIQSKVPPHADADVFRTALELSFINLQVDYLDLFAFHGLNYEEQIEWVFGNEGNNCLSVIQEYVRLGKIQHIGFSTHGSTDLICRCIETNVFDYVNLHYHYFGSYTASGKGNIDAIQLLEERDMGKFIISPFDKGGRLYAPSRQLCSTTFPDMEPMTFQSLWIWNHHHLVNGGNCSSSDNSENGRHQLQLHTNTVGAGRPSDLDQPLVAAYLHATQQPDTLQKLQSVVNRLDLAKNTALGRDWVDHWWKGLPKSTGSAFLVEHNQLVWIYNNIQAFGLYEFGKARYASFESNEAKWDPTKTNDENIIQNVGQNVWGFVPGRTWRSDVDYTTADLQLVPAAQLSRVLVAEHFVYTHCRKEADDTVTQQPPNGDGVIIIPDEWKTAYDLRPWPDYPDRPSRG